MQNKKKYLQQLKNETLYLSNKLSVLREFVNDNLRIDKAYKTNVFYNKLHGGPYGEIMDTSCFLDKNKHPTIMVREEIALLYPDAIPIKYFPQFLQGYFEPGTIRYRFSLDEQTPFLFYGLLEGFEKRNNYHELTISDPYVKATLRADKDISPDYIHKSIGKIVFCQIYIGKTNGEKPFIAEAVNDVISYEDAIPPDAFE